MSRSRAEPGRRQRRPEEAPSLQGEHDLLSLQRQLGNQAVLRLLQAGRSVARKEPPPTVLGEQPVSQPELYKTTDAKQWAARVRAGGAEYINLYSEIAKLLNAGNVEDVKGTEPTDIHGALRTGFGELEPGLNWVRSSGSRGQCAYLYDGKWDQKLPDTVAGDEPKVAIVLSERAFDPDNKAYTLGVLRHELEHAVHNRMAADWLKRWRDDAKARKTPFRSWLRDQTLNATDRALVSERLEGRKSGTEALANAEGFMAAFTVEAPGLTLADAPAEEELKDVAGYWLQADKAVQKEVSARLLAYGARLTGDLRKRFLATLEKLTAENSAWDDLFDPLIKAQKAKKRP
ncbi:MAG: hypothetical protein ACRDK0_07575 [Solirubrobacteraceae bacterium]